jgi:hypothetical protein
VPSANTLVRWVDENAFAFIVQARPCPTLGRPVHRRGSPHRLRPGISPHTLRIPPHDGHPVLRSTARNGFRSTLAVSSFRLRARLGFSIPFPFSGQRGITPAFGYSAPHPGAGGTSTLLNNALLSAHYGHLRPCAPHRYSCSRKGHLLELLPLHRDDRFLRSSPKPESGSRRLNAGCRLDSKQVPSNLIPERVLDPGFDIVSNFRHVVSGLLAFVFPTHT